MTSNELNYLGAFGKLSDRYLGLRHATRDVVRIIDIKIRFLRPEAALAHVTYEIRGMSDDDGKELPPHTELSLRLFPQMLSSSRPPGR